MSRIASHLARHAEALDALARQYNTDRLAMRVARARRDGSIISYEWEGKPVRADKVIARARELQQP